MTLNQNQTEYVMVIMKDGEMVDILSDYTATGVLLQAAEKGYTKLGGYEMPNFPEIKQITS